MNATTAIFIDKYHPKADGKCALSLRVTFDRKKRYYSLPYTMTVEEFGKVCGEKPRGEYKSLAMQIQAYEKKASDIIHSLPVFTWLQFEKHYLSNRAAKDSIEYAFDEYAEMLRTEGRISTAVSYECAKGSLSRFMPGLKFADVTPALLSKYERWMIDSGNSPTTIGIYLRSLRTLFNNAIADGALSVALYPFGKKKYEIPTGVNIKKALNMADIATLYNYEGPGSLYKDYWVFMYLCNGINVKDMCRLKYGNIKDGVVVFERAKTARTKRKVEPIRLPLLDEAKAIIEKYGNADKSEDSYIFPVLEEGLTPERERQLIQQMTKTINKHMRVIAGNIGISSKVTTYSARHSFATILQRSGVSTDFISQALGHSNVRTTQNYLAGFEDESKREALKALTAFKSKPY